MTVLKYSLQALGGCAAVALLASCDGGARTQPALSTQPQTLRTSAPSHRSGKHSDFLGCPYPSGDVWQRDISRSQVDPNSAAYIQAANDAGGGGSFVAAAPTTDEMINAATNATPIVAVEPKVKWHTPYSPWPWETGYYIEPLSDAHALVLQTQACEYFEGYGTTYSQYTLSMYNGGEWALTQPFVRPSQGAISTASGIPLGMLAVRPEELTAGVIRHALGWDGVAKTWSQSACVSPAGVTDCTDDLTYQGPASDNPMPYGAHIRLKSSFDDSSFPNEAKIVAEALKRYGAYAYDTGCCNTIPFVNDSNGAPTWTYADSAALSSIDLSEFDVVVAP